MGTPGSAEMRMHWCRRFIAALHEHGLPPANHEEAQAAYEVAGMLSPEDAAVLLIDIGVVNQQAEPGNAMHQRILPSTPGRSRSA